MRMIYTKQKGEKEMRMIYTNLNTLTEVSGLLEEIGIGSMFPNNEKEDIKLEKLIPQVANKLIKEKMLNRFCQIVTREKEVDFGELPLDETLEIIDGFFTGIWQSMPERWKNTLQAAMKELQTFGQRLLKLKDDTQDSTVYPETEETLT